MRTVETQKLIQVLSDLISIPSVNPAFKALGPNDFGESGVADYLEALAGKAGLECERQEVIDGRENIIIRMFPAGGIVKKRVMFAPHMDTVSVDNASQLMPELKGGKLHGRGACDTKGSITAMLMTLVAMTESRKRPKQTEIIFAGLVDEENRQMGSRHLAQSMEAVDLAVIGEPTLCRVVTAHKGDVWQRITVKGRSAHGAQPHLGDNAISKMSKLIQAIEDQYVPGLKARAHPLLGNPTLNIGIIRGGVQSNIVPNSCSIEVDRRTLPGENEQSFRDEINQLVQSLDPDLELEWADTKGVECLPMESDPDIEEIQKIRNLTPNSDPLGVSYFCDAAVIRTNGSPCVVFGPGSIDQAHTEDEWIEVASLESAHQILLNYCASLP